MVRFWPRCGGWEICAENRQEMPIWEKKLWKSLPVEGWCHR